MKTNVDELTGLALIWAAIRAEGHVPQVGANRISYRSDHGSTISPWYSVHEAADLAAEHWIGTERPSKGQTPPRWHAIADYKGPRNGSVPVSVVSAWHERFEVAVTRCFVKSRFGEFVDVPQEVFDLASALAKKL